MPSLPLEGLVIYLTKEERRTLFQFLLLYLSSSFILFAVIAYLFYENESKAFYEKSRNLMQMNASVLSSKIIHAHMSQQPFSFKRVVQNYEGKIGFYNQNNEPIESSITIEIDFSQQLYEQNGYMVLVDYSTLGHLGVKSIVIEQEGVVEHIGSLKFKILLYLLFVYGFLTIVGFFLAKLFIKPIQMKRIQLDNFIKESTHELNTPITALMLSLDAPKLESAKNLERIKLSAKRVSEIYKDLSYLMLEDEKEKVVEAFSLNTLLKEALSYLMLLAEKQKVTIEVHEEHEIYFKIDKESFMRLIHNLLNNAIKYNKTNGLIEITIVENRIIIRDRGIGIPKKNQAAIYERFYRASDQVGGFGLGLNIVDKVCKTYGIGIAFESEVGVGTTFTLTFQ